MYSVRQWLSAAWRLARRRWAYILSLAPFPADWVDAGHWPDTPREYVAELSLGALIGCAVWFLYREHDVVRALADRDPLTGLPNSRRFREDLGEALARARKSGIPVTVGIADLDGFKGVNDRLGHAAGDALLCQAARLMRSVLREASDRCYRVGGDEFAVILEGTSETLAVDVFERLRDTVRSGLEGYGVGVSLGWARGCLPGEAALLVERADQAMYAAKPPHGRRAGDPLPARAETG